MNWNLILFIPIFFSFLLSIIGIPNWIKKCKKTGYLWKDMNKYQGLQNVAASGGFIVVMSFILGILSYIAILNIAGQNISLLETSFLTIPLIIFTLFGLLSVILISAFVGIVDDILGWKKKGLSIWSRLFFIFLTSIPLIVINAGAHRMDLPFLGLTNLGILYPLILIPLGIVGATTTFNFLAGFNGLEAGQGIIVLSFLSFVAYMTGSPWLAFVGLIMVIPLIVFYKYNRFPAKIFPGDALTYSVGSLIAMMAILGNFEKIAVFIFIPYILETVLKLRGKLKKESFVKPSEDGSLEMPYEKIYGLTHLSLFILKKFKKKVCEKDVVRLIFVFQVIVCILALILFRRHLF